MSDTQSNIVIDNGSGSIKCGFSSEETPKTIFSTVICKHTGEVGEESLSNLSSPIEHGIITNWEDMEKIWQHTFTNQLRVSSEERNVLMSDAPIGPKINREKITQMMFEKFNVQGLFISVQAVLSLYSVGKTTGLIVDSGDDVTHIVPITEGFYLPHTITKTNLGGKAVTDYLIKALSDRGLKFDLYETKKLAKEIKEKASYVSLNYETELKDAKMNEIKYKLPDGTEFSVSKELFVCPETIFKPDLLKKEIPGIHDQIYNSIMKSEIELRKELYSNIILSGGNTLFLSYPERLTQEMQKLAPNSMMNKVKVIAQSERKYSTWIGGSILSGLSNFQTMWITHNEYQDAGPQIVHRKCF